MEKKMDCLQRVLELRRRQKIGFGRRKALAEAAGGLGGWKRKKEKRMPWSCRKREKQNGRKA